MDEIPLRNRIFTTQIEQKVLGLYRRIFSIQEIESSKVLQLAFGAILFGFFVTFNSWTNDPWLTVQAVADNTYLCWPYFQSCGDYYFLSTIPYGYSQNALYGALFGIMVLVAYLMYKKDWVLAHMAMVVLFIWEFCTIFVFSALFNASFDYYHIVLALVLLFLPFKDFFLKITFVVLYFLSGMIKIHEGWILGTYFSSLFLGLPLLPDWAIPFATHSVIVLEIILCWFLLSRRPFLQRSAVAFFFLFHLYSITLIWYHFAAVTIPLLLILFGPLYISPKTPVSKKAIIGWVFVGLVFFFQSISFFIPGDAKMTLEANRFGLYMLEANHQCVSKVYAYKTDGIVEPYERVSIRARQRCSPYDDWFHIQQFCKRSTNLHRVVWTLDHSINGGPFYRTVDVTDACALEYKALQHNEWIKTPEEGARIIGFPVKNVF